MVKKANLDTALGFKPFQPVDGAVIHHFLRHYMVAGIQGFKQGHHRRHAAGKDQRTGGFIKIGQQILGHFNRRAAGTGIDIALARRVFLVAGIGAGKVKRGGDRAGQFINMVQRLRGAGSGRKFELARH